MAKDLKEILGGAKEARDIAQANLSATTSSAEQELKELQASILVGGEGTGNSLYDGVVAIFGAELLEGPAILERYEKAARLLEEAHLLDPVLLIERGVGHDGSSFMGPALEETVTMGLLKAKEIGFYHQTPEAFIPTSIFARRRFHRDEESLAESGVITVDGPAHFWFSLSHGLGYGLDSEFEIIREMPVSREQMSREKYIALELLVGRSAIENWLDQDDPTIYLPRRESWEGGTVEKLSRALGIKPIVA